MEGEKNKRRRERYVAIEPGEDRERTNWKNEQFCGEEEPKRRQNHEVQKQLRVTDKKKMNKDPRLHKERQEDQEPPNRNSQGGTSEFRRKAPLCVGTGPQSGLRRRIEKYRDDIDTFF